MIWICLAFSDGPPAKETYGKPSREPINISTSSEKKDLHFEFESWAPPSLC